MSRPPPAAEEEDAHRQDMHISVVDGLVSSLVHRQQYRRPRLVQQLINYRAEMGDAATARMLLADDEYGADDNFTVVMLMVWSLGWAPTSEGGLAAFDACAHVSGVRALVERTACPCQNETPPVSIE